MRPRGSGWVGTQGGKLQELNRLLRGATDTSFLATGRGLSVRAACVS